MTIPLVTLVQWLVYAAILGGVTISFGIWYKRKFFKGKIKCFFYMRNRNIEELFLQPNDSNMLEFNEGLYTYDRRWVRLVKHWIAGTVPSLTFREDNPVPISIEGYTQEELKFTSRQIKSDFEDKALKTLGQMDGGDFSEISKKFNKSLIVSLGVIVSFMLLGFWLVYQQIAELQKVVLPIIESIE